MFFIRASLEAGGVKAPIPKHDEAEREGFEPSMDETAHTGFRDRRIQPLCHLSGGAVNKLAHRAGQRPRRAVGSSPRARRWTLSAGRVLTADHRPTLEGQRWEPKNARSRSAQSSASSPDSTWGRWLSLGSARTLSTLPAAPALGSVVPNT